MQKEIRALFNSNFTEEKYAAYMKDVEAISPCALDFRNAETPIFVPKDFTNKMLGACEDIIDVIVAPNFKELTQRSIPNNLMVSGNEEHAQLLVFDFGICDDGNGGYEPQLIEMQGFPTLFAFQAIHSELTATYANVPSNYSSYLNGYNKETYLQLFKEIVIGNTNIDEVVLLEIYPEKQKTRIDFDASEKLIGVKTLCLTKLKANGKQLYYNKENGDEQIITRIYNRLIFDDLNQQQGLENIIDLTKEYNVTWIPHPNWFYRISKYTLPFINNKYVPETFFLNEIKNL